MLCIGNGSIFFVLPRNHNKKKVKLVFAFLGMIIFSGRKVAFRRLGNAKKKPFPSYNHSPQKIIKKIKKIKKKFKVSPLP